MELTADERRWTQMIFNHGWTRMYTDRGRAEMDRRSGATWDRRLAGHDPRDAGPTWSVVQNFSGTGFVFAPPVTLCGYPLSVCSVWSVGRMDRRFGPTWDRRPAGHDPRDAGPTWVGLCASCASLRLSRIAGQSSAGAGALNLKGIRARTTTDLPPALGRSNSHCCTAWAPA
jgi:hypothetical protein